MTCFFRHHWSKWIQEDRLLTQTWIAGVMAGKSYDICQIWQHRTCDDCGKYQDQKVSEGRVPEDVKLRLAESVAERETQKVLQRM